MFVTPSRSFLPFLALPFFVLLAPACDRGAAGDEAGQSAKQGEPAPASTADTPEVHEPSAKAGEPGTPPAKPDAPTATPPDAKARATAVKAAAKAGRGELESSRAQLAKLLDDGRQAVKAKRYDEGIALYRQALKIDPVHPKVLGELGFAALREGDLELAESSTRRAIDFAPDDHAGLGALYYNLGLIAEQREDPTAARAAFERSLAVRPDNAVVQGKLAQLTKLGASPPAKRTAQPEGLCAELMAEWECYASEAEIEALPADEQDYAGLCTCTIGQRLDEGSGASFIEAAAVIEISGMAGAGGSIEDSYLAIETAGDGWQLIGQLVNGYTPGVMGISNHGSLDAIEFVDLAPAPGNELRVTVSNSEIDSNMGINTIDFWDSKTVYLCHADSRTAGACTILPIAASSGTEPLFDDEEVDPDAELGVTSWALAVEFAQGKVEIAVTSGEAHLPAELAALVGGRPFAEVVAAAGLVAVRLH